MQAILSSLEEERSLLPLKRGMRNSLSRIEEVSDFTTPAVKAFLETDAICLPRRLEVDCERSLSSGRRGHLEASVLRHPLH